METQLVVRAARLWHAARRLAARGESREGKKGSLKCGRPDPLSESCRRRETLLRGLISGAAKYCQPFIAHDRQHAMGKLGTHTLAVCVSAGDFLSSADPPGACMKSFSAIWQPGVVWCKNMFINSHVFFRQPTGPDLFGLACADIFFFCLQPKARMKFLFLMSLLTFKRKFLAAYPEQFYVCSVFVRNVVFQWGSLWCVRVTDKSAATVCRGRFRTSEPSTFDLQWKGAGRWTLIKNTSWSVLKMFLRPISAISVV